MNTAKLILSLAGVLSLTDAKIGEWDLYVARGY